MVMNDIDLNSCKVYSLSWSEFSTSLSTAVQNLRNKEDLIDVTISAGGKHFSAHKLVLGAASPLLMDLLKNTTCQHPILMLAGISASDLETILNFVYYGEINIDSEKLPSLLQAAQFLDIRALSPAALVLNSFQSSMSSLKMSTDKDINLEKNSSSNDTKKNHQGNKQEINEIKLHSQRRKRSMKSIGSVYPQKRAELNCNDENANKVKETLIPENDQDPQMITKIQSEPPCQIEGTLRADEKKIISDLPVNCKLCGVLIRQSRNLRRHMDQMHSKIKAQKDEHKKKRKLDPDINRNIKKNDSSYASALLDFSDESFNQLTEEIFNYSSMPDAISNANTFPISSSTSVDSCVMEDSQCTTTTSSTLLCAVPQSLNSLLNDIYLHLPTTKTMTITTETPSMNSKKSTSVDHQTSNENFEYNNLENEDDCCNSEDTSNDIMTFKELDNQLLSACFCSNESEV